MYAEGLFLFLCVWPCHVCVLGRSGRSQRAQLWYSVSLLVDMLTFTTPLCALCCSHYRDSGLTDCQKSQHSINLLSQLTVNGDKMHARCTHWFPGNTHTHPSGVDTEGQEIQKLAGVIIPSEENDWKLVTFVQTGPWFTSLWLYSLVQKKDGFQVGKYDNIAAVKINWHAWSISHDLFQYWSGIKRGFNKHAAKTSSTVYHQL